MAVFGDTLRQARARKGVTLREAEQATRINRLYLLALEEENFEQLPAPIYQRGIVKNYASYLDLNPATVLRMYNEALGDAIEPEPVVITNATQPLAPAGGLVPNFAVIGFIVVMMGVIFAWGYSAYVATPGGTDLTQAPPTATAISEDDRFIPSPTSAPPTATATATREEPTEEPVAEEDAAAPSSGGQQIRLATQTATAEPVEITLGDDSDDAANEESVAVSEGGEVAFSFYAAEDVTLTVVADNVVLWEGPLGAGNSTGYLPGTNFVVTFSGADELLVIREDSSQFTIDGPTVNLP